MEGAVILSTWTQKAGLGENMLQENYQQQSRAQESSDVDEGGLPQNTSVAVADRACRPEKHHVTHASFCNCSAGLIQHDPAAKSAALSASDPHS